MQRIDQHYYDAREPVRSTFAAGLRDMFAACHDPLPPKMEELIRRLREHDDHAD
jgi:hypothetical protein